MKRAIALTTPLLSIAALVAMPACARVDGSAPPAAGAAVTVAVEPIARGDIERVLTIAAEFRPFQEIEVHAKVAGYLKTIPVDVGDRVAAGQLLAVLEVPELENEMQQDEAGVKRAEQECNRARAELTRAQSAYDVAHVSATRLAGVMTARPKLVAQQDVDEANGRDRVAEAQVATAQAALAASEQQLDMARAARDKTKTLIGYARISAPFAGVITRRYADTGAMIQAGTSSQTQSMPVVRLSDNSRLRLVIPVPESAVSHIHVGDSVRVAVEALGTTYTGKVARFADRLDGETRTMRVEVDVPNLNLALVPGMYAEASIILDEARGVLVAPVEAIEQTGNTARVLLVDRDHHIQSQQVTRGLDSGNQVAVTSGLSAGDLVVIGSRSQLKPGMAVVPKVMAPSAGEGAK